MENRKNKVGAVLTALGLMVGTAAGCSSRIDEYQTAEQNGEEPFTITVMLQDYSGSPMSGEYADEVLEKLESYMNCQIDFSWVATKDYEDKVGMMLAQGEGMPMVMQVDMNADVLSAARAGTFWDLTEFLPDEENLPNLSQADETISRSFLCRWTVDWNLPLQAHRKIWMELPAGLGGCVGNSRTQDRGGFLSNALSVYL